MNNYAILTPMSGKHPARKIGEGGAAEAHELISQHFPELWSEQIHHLQLQLMRMLLKDSELMTLYRTLYAAYVTGCNITIPLTDLQFEAIEFPEVAVRRELSVPPVPPHILILLPSELQESAADPKFVARFWGLMTVWAGAVRHPQIFELAGARIKDSGNSKDKADAESKQEA